MKLYSYIVARDYGFAPNPFHGYCTIATCKPGIRNKADINDWVIGTGSKQLNCQGKLLFSMKIKEKLLYNNYWNDSRFQNKKPVMNGSFKQMYGDNIYSYDDDTDNWIQSNSHHSHDDGSENDRNKSRDLKSKFVLISKEYYYLGQNAISIPRRFRANNDDICLKGQGYKRSFSDVFVDSFINWLHSSFDNRFGYYGDPIQFHEFKRYKGPF